MWPASDDSIECRHRMKVNCKGHKDDIEEISLKHPWGFDCGRLKTSILRTNRGPFVLDGLLPVGCEE